MAITRELSHTNLVSLNDMLKNESTTKVDEVAPFLDNLSVLKEYWRKGVKQEANGVEENDDSREDNVLPQSFFFRDRSKSSISVQYQSKGSDEQQRRRSEEDTPLFPAPNENDKIPLGSYVPAERLPKNQAAQSGSGRYGKPKSDRDETADDLRGSSFNTRLPENFPWMPLSEYEDTTAKNQLLELIKGEAVITGKLEFLRGTDPRKADETKLSRAQGGRAYFLEGDELKLDSPIRSYWMPENHPLSYDLVHGTASLTSSNWYERIQWHFRNIFEQQEAKKHLGKEEQIPYKFELEFYKEIGRFATAAKVAAVALLHSEAIGKRDATQIFLELKRSDLLSEWSRCRPKFDEDRVFIFDSIVFTIVLGSKKRGISTELAKRIYGNDFNGQQAFADGVAKLGKDSNFAIPARILVDYTGFRVVCEPLIPPSVPIGAGANSDEVNLNNSSVEGEAAEDDAFIRKAAKASTFAHLNFETKSQLKAIALDLNLKEYPTGLEFSDLLLSKLIEPHSTAKILHCFKDNRLIFKNADEVLPPVCSGHEVVFNSRLRQNFVQRHNEALWSSLEFSKVKKPKAEFTDVPIKDKHSANYYSDGASTFQKYSRATNAMIQLVNRELIPILDNGDCNFSDSWEVTHFLHALGINMRHLGVIVRGEHDNGYRDIVFQEIFARSIKRIWERWIHKQREKLKSSKQLEVIVASPERITELLNIILEDSEVSTRFWKDYILPEAQRRFNVDFSADNIFPKKLVNLQNLLKSLQFHLGLKFKDGLCTHEENECVKRFNISDLSEFDEDRETGLFQYRTSILNSLQLSDQDIHDFKLRRFHIFKGFYPKIKIIFPHTLTSYQAAYLRLTDQQNHIKLPPEIMVDWFRKGYQKLEGKELLLNGNSVTMGRCAPLKAVILGGAYPCYPFCVYTPTGNFCENFQKDRVSMEFLLKANTLAGKDPIIISKMIVYLGYIFLKHGFAKEASELAEVIAYNFPDVGTLYSDAMLLLMQAELAPDSSGYAVQYKKEILGERLIFEGKYSFYILQANLLIAAYFFEKKQHEKVCKYASNALDTSIQKFGWSNAHWTAIAASRLMGKSYMKLKDYSKAISVFEALVALSDSQAVPKFIRSINRSMLANALKKHGFIEGGCIQGLRALHELEDCLGPFHSFTLNTLYLSAKLLHHLGCMKLANPPLELSFSDQDCDESVAHKLLLLNILPSDMEVIEEYYNDPKDKKYREEALNLYSVLFERLVCQTKMENIYTYDKIRYYEGRVNYELQVETQLSRLCAVIRNTFEVVISSWDLSTQRDLSRKLMAIFLSFLRGDKDSKFLKNNAAKTFDNSEKKLFYDSSNISDYEKLLGATARSFKFLANEDSIVRCIQADEAGIPCRYFDHLLFQILLFSPPISSIESICLECLQDCKKNGKVPKTWLRELFEDVLNHGNEKKLKILVDLMRLLWTPLQKHTFCSHIGVSNELFSNSRFSNLINMQLDYEEKLEKLGKPQGNVVVVEENLEDRDIPSLRNSYDDIYNEGIQVGMNFNKISKEPADLHGTKIWSIIDTNPQAEYCFLKAASKLSDCQDERIKVASFDDGTGYILKHTAKFSEKRFAKNAASEQLMDTYGLRSKLLE